MSLPTDKPSACHDCGARSAPGTTRCWLCGSELQWPASSSAVASSSRASRTRPSGPRPGDIDPDELQPSLRAAAREAEPTDEEFADVELVPDRPGASPYSYTITAIIAGMTIIAIAAGLLHDAPGLSVLVSVVGIPALLVTVIRMGRLRSSGREVTWTNRVLTFIVSSLAVVGIIVMVSIAAIMALFIYCLVVCTSGGKMF